MTTKLVLRADVGGIGKRGDIVEVADGFARNHLIPGGFAIRANSGVAQQANAMRRARDVKDARDREAAESVATKLVPLVISIAARAGRGGRLFGSVTPGDVVEAVAKQSGIELDRHRFLSFEPIKTLGTHEVRVRLHPEVEFALTVEVVGG